MLVLAATPKCLLCVLGYLGLAAGLGLARTELCGGAASPHAGLALVVGSFLFLAAVAIWAQRQKSR